MPEVNWYYAYIIESPRPEPLDEELAGRNGEMLSETLEANEVWASGYPKSVQSREEFRTALEIGMASFISQTHTQALLHLSCHGNEDGICLAGDLEQRISWRALGPLLQEMNLFLQGQLIVCLSTCSGFAGAPVLVHEYGLSAVVGPSARVTWQNATVMFQEFYRTLASTYSVKAAVDTMNLAYHADEWGPPTFVQYPPEADVLLRSLGEVDWLRFWSGVGPAGLLTAISEPSAGTRADGQRIVPIIELGGERG